MFFLGLESWVMYSQFQRIYTHDINVLSAFVEEARQGYVRTNRPHVIVHTADQVTFFLRLPRPNLIFVKSYTYTAQLRTVIHMVQCQI